MPEKILIPAMETRDIALALVQVLKLWSNERYKPFLLQPEPGELTEEWFRWFVGAWNVARTIKNDKQKFVREYLDRDFRAKLLKGGDADAVHEAVKHIQHQGGGSKTRKDGKGSLTISLVSKVGFFLCPARLVLGC